jgi:hypothetical protein
MVWVTRAICGMRLLRNWIRREEFCFVGCEGVKKGARFNDDKACRPHIIRPDF